MSDVRNTAGKQYIPCDTFEQFVESDFGRYIEGFMYTIDKDGLLTITGGDGKVQVYPYQVVFITDDERICVV